MSKAMGKNAAFFAAKLLIGMIMMFPVFYALMVSLMPPEDISVYPPRVLPRQITFGNYLSVMDTYPVFRFLLNSLIQCGIVIISQTILSSLSAYALVFYDFPGKTLLFTLIQCTMMIPAETIIIANYITICNLQLINTYTAIVLPYLISGMAIFMMRQYYLTIPRELKEASEIDGCKDLRFIFSVLVPLSIPTIAALSVYTFVRTYNQYMWPLFVTNSMRMRTVQVGVSMLIDGEAINYGNVTAGAIYVLMPVMAVFILGQKYLIQGMTSGAVKG